MNTAMHVTNGDVALLALLAGLLHAAEIRIHYQSRQDCYQNQRADNHQDQNSATTTHLGWPKSPPHVSLLIGMLGLSRFPQGSARAA